MANTTLSAIDLYYADIMKQQRIEMGRAIHNSFIGNSQYYDTYTPQVKTQSTTDDQLLLNVRRRNKK